MIALGVVGWSGSGKTTLVTQLIPAFMRRGLRVSTVKHAHHDLTFDRPGKDSFRHAEAGAEEVILAAGGRFGLFSRHGGGLDALLERLAPVDLVLVEGFKSYPGLPKLEVYRPGVGDGPLFRHMEVLAVASDAALADCPVPVLDINAPEIVTDFLFDALGLERARAKE